MPGPEVGVFLPTISRPGELPGDIAAAARQAENLGLESVWAVDQLIAGTGTPLIDSMVALSVAAGATTRIRLGFGVMILPLRPVVWVAKQVASLQHVSGGRVILGVGAGGDRHEASCPGHVVLDWDAFMGPAAALAGREIPQEPETWPAYRECRAAHLSLHRHKWLLRC